MAKTMGVSAEKIQIQGKQATQKNCAAYFPLYAAAAFSVPFSTMHKAASAAW